jgi:uncharacterized protein
MNTYITRKAENRILQLVRTFPVVVIVGPRQVGKTSLAKNIAQKFDQPSVYLDLENPADYNKLNNPTLFLKSVKESTVILDEVQRVPSLFPILRSIVDQDRHPGRFILLGSASPELIRDTSESLAGRVAFFELPTFVLEEIEDVSSYQELWLRGGFPESLLAADEENSLAWRENFIQTYLERDLPLLGLRADPMLIRRLWTMVAHSHGNLLNLDALAGSLGITGPTVRRYLDYLESAYLIRRLPPLIFNIRKRLIKSPKYFIRDTGILHTLLGIDQLEQLQGHPALGNSWEGFVLQLIAAYLPPRMEVYFYRTQDGTEGDIVIGRGGIPEILIEIKYSVTPKLTKGFHIAKTDLQTSKNFIICPVEQAYPISEDVMVCGLKDIPGLFAK